LVWARVLGSRRMLVCLLSGFSSGLPLYVTLSLLPAWLRDNGASLRNIGLLSLTGLPYAWKFVWAPLLDRYTPPWLGRRRGWSLATQLALLLLIASFALFDARGSLTAIAALTLVLAFVSATQDVAVDAYRRELLADNELGLGSAMYVNGYRAAALIPGSLALILADHMPWPWVFVIVAAFMAVGALTSLWMPETPHATTVPVTLRDAVIGPFAEFFARRDRRAALATVAFMLLFKLGDTMAAALLTPFYLDLGYTKTIIGSVAKAISLPAIFVGSLIGGLTMTRIGINRALWLFGTVQLVSTFAFVLLAGMPPDPVSLGFVVGIETLGSALGTSAFMAFLSRTTHRSFTATQYALFSSLVALPRTLASASTGFLAEALGYRAFFAVCALLAAPGMLLLSRVAPWGDVPEDAALDLARRPVR
jgi:PAT family beta-lactamase induction signal transducer AmpG